MFRSRRSRAHVREMERRPVDGADWFNDRHWNTISPNGTSADPFPVALGAGGHYRISPVPSGLQDAIVSARSKYYGGLPLRYDLAPMLQVARDKQAAEMKAHTKSQSA